MSMAWGEYIRGCGQRVPKRGQAGGRKLREESNIIPIILKKIEKQQREYCEKCWLSPPTQKHVQHKTKNARCSINSINSRNSETVLFPNH